MTHSKFSKRERAAIAIATLAFLGISSLTHLAIGGYLAAHMPHWSAPAPDQSPMVIGVTTLATPTPTPTPIATPTPRAAKPTRATPARTPSRTPVVKTAPPHVAKHPPGPGVVEPTPAPSGPPQADETPLPIASPTPSDTQTEYTTATPATFKHKIVPEYPQVCADEGAGGTVEVFVTIDGDGSLAGARVGQTSGFPCLDDAALTAAKESTYNPPEVGGRPVAETYLIVYEFSIDS